MAEAPLDGLYGPRVLLDADGTVELRGGPAGPAGVSVVELADGTVWSVDHADPTRLVGIEPPAGPAGPPWDLADSPLVIAAVGGDQALLLADLADDARAAMTHGDRADPVADLDDDLDDELDDELADAALDDRPRSPRRIRPNNRMGPEAGRIVVLADLSTDPDLDPLARIAAGSSTPSTRPRAVSCWNRSSPGSCRPLVSTPPTWTMTTSTCSTPSPRRDWGRRSGW